jgi:hypothetical protein
MFVRDENGKIIPKKGMKPKPLTFENQPLVTLTASKITRNEDVNTTNEIPKSISSLQKSRESISIQVDSHKISEPNEDKQFVDGDEAKRKFLESLHSNISVLETNGITPNKESTVAKVIDTVKPRPQELKPNPIVRKEIDDNGIDIVSLDEEITKHPKSYHFSTNSILPDAQSASINENIGIRVNETEPSKSISNVQQPKIPDFKCQLCPSKYANQNGLDTHMERIHNESEKYDKINNARLCNDDQPKDDNCYEYLCLFRNSSIPDEALIKEHINSLHFIPNANCFHCPYSSTIQADLIFHGQQRHYQRYSLFKLICLKCEFTSSEARKIIQHVQASHNGEGIIDPFPFRCSISACTFRSHCKKDFDYHVKHTHRNKSPILVEYKKDMKVATKDIALQTTTNDGNNEALSSQKKTKEVVTPGTMNKNNLLTCILCRINVKFEGVPATHYIRHLLKEHNVLFEPEFIVDKTLQTNSHVMKRNGNQNICINKSKHENELDDSHSSGSIVKSGNEK